MRAPGWWLQLRELLDQSTRQQITASGLGFTCAILLVGLAAFASANNLLFLLLAVMLATLLLSGFISRLGLANLELEFTLPDHLSANEPIRGRISLYNSKRWMPSFSLHVIGKPGSGLQELLYFPLVSARSHAQQPVTFLFPQRGLQGRSLFWVSSRFPFGFTERHVPVALRRELLVYPCLLVRPQYEELLGAVMRGLRGQQRGAGEDFYGLRPYVFGESARRLDWKASARTRQPQLREFAHERDAGLVVVLDQQFAAADAAWFEQAVECAAVLIAQVSARGGQTRLRCADADGLTDLYAMLKVLALAGPKTASLPVAITGDSDIAVVFTTRPAHAVAAGWAAARLLTPAVWTGADAGAGENHRDSAG